MWACRSIIVYNFFKMRINSDYEFITSTVCIADLVISGFLAPRLYYRAQQCNKLINVSHLFTIAQCLLQSSQNDNQAIHSEYVEA